MSDRKLMLCTDMDRTVIPNGVQSEYKLARKQFTDFCHLPQVMLTYVTGRHQKLVRQAIKNYSLPLPDFAITDVGTKIYHIVDQQWQVLSAWEEEIDRDWGGRDHAQLKALLDDFNYLQPQELAKQNTHKLSYYVSLHVDQETLLAKMSRRLEMAGVEASLIWSIDEPKGIGLLDVLPKNATKLHAIDFLRRYAGFSLDEVVFAGDSGNDLPVLASEIPSVLVANAAEDVRVAALEQARNHGNQAALYLATGNNSHDNGNYASGVLEGIYHFSPPFRGALEQIGFTGSQEAVHSG